jgi:hypothetical protein
MSNPFDSETQNPVMESVVLDNDPVVFEDVISNPPSERNSSVCAHYHTGKAVDGIASINGNPISFFVYYFLSYSPLFPPHFINWVNLILMHFSSHFTIVGVQTVINESQLL